MALYLAFWLVPGFVVAGSVLQYILGGAILAVLNMTVRPFLKLISFPLILLTLGLFTVVINMLVLWLFDYLVTFVTIQSLMALVLATIIISIVNMFFSGIAKAAD